MRFHLYLEEASRSQANLCVEDEVSGSNNINQHPTFKRVEGQGTGQVRVPSPFKSFPLLVS